MGTKPLPLKRMFGALLLIPSRAIVREIAMELERAGYGDVSPAQFSVFQHLPVDGARVIDLASQAQITKQSMSALVRSLEAGGYVTRKSHPDDRRATIVLRTDRGWAVEGVARATIARIEREWARELGDERFQVLRQTLEDLVTLIEAEPDANGQ